MNSSHSQEYLILEKAKELQLFLLGQKITLWGSMDQYQKFIEEPNYDHEHSFWKVVFPVFYEECKKILDTSGGDESVKIGFIDHLSQEIQSHCLADVGIRSQGSGFQITLINRLIKTYNRDILALLESPLYQKIYLNKEIMEPKLSSNDIQAKNKI